MKKSLIGLSVVMIIVLALGASTKIDPATRINWPTCTAGQAYAPNTNTCFTPTGSGTINSGTAGQVAYYASNGTTLTGTNSVTGLTVDGVTPTEFGYLDATSSIQTQLNGKQGSITLTTTGTSGAATLSGGALNIPQYAGGGSTLAPFTAVTIVSNAGTLATSGNAFTNGTVALSHTSTTTINVSGLANGANFNIRLTQDSSGGNTLTLGTGCTWLQGSGTGFVASTTPVLTASASGINMLSAVFDGSSCLYNVR